MQITYNDNDGNFLRESELVITELRKYKNGDINLLSKRPLQYKLTTLIEMCSQPDSERLILPEILGSFENGHDRYNFLDIVNLRTRKIGEDIRLRSFGYREVTVEDYMYLDILKSLKIYRKHPIRSDASASSKRILETSFPRFFAI